jgi:hypothetical protein
MPSKNTTRVIDLIPKDAILRGCIVYWNEASGFNYGTTTKPRTRKEFEDERLGNFVSFILDPDLTIEPTPKYLCDCPGKEFLLKTLCIECGTLTRLAPIE